MFIGTTLPFVKTYVAEVDAALRRLTPEAGITRLQGEWLGFCLVAILVTNSVCWKRFERASLGQRTASALSWMFRHTRHFWPFLLQASTRVLLAKYGITKGVIVVDDSDKKRAKQTARIYKAHKVKDKKTGGFINGQSFVLLLLVTRTISIPVGIEFYMPDPALTVWNATEKHLKKQGVPKKQRPSKPQKDPDYPTLPEVALQLLEAFHTAFPEVSIQCIVADNLYGTDTFMETASALFGGIQVICKLKKSQNLRFQGKTMKLHAFFTQYPGVKQTIRIRGGDEVTVWVSSARVHVCAHGKKRFVVALKYEGEDEYRYLVASDMSWRHLDIVQAHTLRWLIEVFFQDWKAYEGWGQLTKQPDADGSRRSVLLSLLCDHCLLLHPDQLARIQDKRPACTVGSLRDRVRLESSLLMFQEILLAEQPHTQFEVVAQRAKDIFSLNESKKHLVGRELGRLESTPSLEYRAKSVLKTA